MKPLLLSLASIALLAAPSLGRADVNPHFDGDAKPILAQQPGLVEFVESHFTVMSTGKAMHPGTPDMPPQPPYMFRAKPRGSSGPYTLMLLIQPGPANHILNVVDMTKVRMKNPSSEQVAHQPAPAQQAPALEPAPNPAPSAPATSAPEPTSDTPSGPIMGDGSQSAPPLQPPPDAKPTTD